MEARLLDNLQSSGPLKKSLTARKTITWAKDRNSIQRIYAALKCLRENSSFAPFGACSSPTFTHGLRRFAAVFVTNHSTALAGIEFSCTL